MRENENRVNIEGYLYEADIEKKVTGPNSKNPGTEYIRGTVSIAVDEEGNNIVPVNFTYVTATTSKGNPNKSWAFLNNIVDKTAKTWAEVGKDGATKVSILANLTPNEFYTADGEFVSAMQIEGRFISATNKFRNSGSDRHKFSVDMVITNVKTVDENPERNIPEHSIVKGAIFNYRNDMYEASFRIDDTNGRSYFESLEASSNNPVYTKIWGTVNNITVLVDKIQETAWGDATVQKVPRHFKTYMIENASPNPYEFGEEGVMTAEEFKSVIQNYELRKAEIKARREEWEKKSAGGAIQTPAAANTSNINTGDFKF